MKISMWVGCVGLWMTLCVAPARAAVLDLTNPGTPYASIAGANTWARQTFMTSGDATLLTSFSFFLSRTELFGTSTAFVDLHAWDAQSGATVGPTLWSSGPQPFTGPSFAHGMNPVRQFDFSPDVLLSGGDLYVFSFHIESYGRYLLANSGYVDGTASVFNLATQTWDNRPVGQSLALTMNFEPVPLTAVPLPSTFSLMLGGLGLLGWAGRRASRAALHRVVQA